MQIALSLEADWPASIAWQALAERCLAAIAPLLPPLPATAEVSLQLADDAAVQALNRTWRGKDMPTNVLSFPMFDPAQIAGLIDDPAPEILLGDIILAHETCAAEAAEKGISLADHAAHLIIHGLLHLAGHDHLEDAQAAEMEALEVKALAKLAIGNPYAH